MESEKMKEIKKALECCKNCDCGNCPYCSYGDCESDLREDMETLINELESENERLSNSEIGELIKENKELAKQCVEWNELDFIKRNKIKELKDRIAELEKQMCRNEDLHTATEKLNDMIILKQFAERLKEKITVWYPSTIEAIDETLKEFIEK